MQNHLLQMVTLLTMDPPSSWEPDPVHRAQLRVLEAIRPLAADDVVRGQFRGYQKEKGVKRGSTVETYAAVRLAPRLLALGRRADLRPGRQVPARHVDAR